MRAQPSKNWWKVKARIIERFGTVSACANAIGCSPESLRQATQGKCPGVLQRLNKALRMEVAA